MSRETHLAGNRRKLDPDYTVQDLVQDCFLRHVEQQSNHLPHSKYCSRYFCRKLMGVLNQKYRHKLFNSFLLDQEEFDFVATFLDDHSGNSFESKDLFSIVDSSITKSSREFNVCQSQWRRIANGGNLDFSVSLLLLSPLCC